MMKIRLLIAALATVSMTMSAQNTTERIPAKGLAVYE